MSLRMTPEQVASHQARVKGLGSLTRTASAIAERVEKKSKYGNKRCQEDGYTFDSSKERRRYRELKLLQRAGHISALRIHPVIPLRVNGVVICEFEPDFDYNRGDVMIIEDVKSTATITPIYRVKKKLFEALFGVEVREIL